MLTRLSLRSFKRKKIVKYFFADKVMTSCNSQHVHATFAMHQCSIGFVLWSVGSWFKSGKAWTGRPGRLWHITLSANYRKWNLQVTCNWGLIQQDLNQARHSVIGLTLWCQLPTPWWLHSYSAKSQPTKNIIKPISRNDSLIVLKLEKYNVFISCVQLISYSMANLHKGDNRKLDTYDGKAWYI